MSNFFFPDRNVVNVLQAGRAIAALLVVLHHATLATIARVTHSPEWLIGLSQASVGFNFFFVISGFIIIYAHGADPHDWYSAKTFALRRLARIFLPYLPIAIAVASVYIIYPSLTESRGREWSWFTTLSLLPSGLPSALNVAWTLQHEIIFYTFFISFYFLSRLLFIAISATWAGLIIINWSSPDAGSLTLQSIAFSPLNLLFIAGMLTAIIAKFSPSSLWPLFVTSGIAGIIYCVNSEPSLFARVLLGLSMSPLVLGMVMMERLGIFRPPKFLTTLGSASYGLYLIHDPIISILSRALKFTDNWAVTLLTCIIGSVLAGLAYHFAFEKPIIKKTKQLYIAKKPATSNTCQ